jgi:hypothetical protein
MENKPTHLVPNKSLNFVPARAAPTVQAKVFIIRITAIGFWILSRKFFQIDPTKGLFSDILAISAMDRLMRHASRREQKKDASMETRMVMMRSATSTPVIVLVSI